MAQLPYRDASFDLVVNADVLQHLTGADAVAAVTEVRRVLRPGGAFLVRVNGDSFRGDVRQRENWRLYGPALLETELVAAGLVVDRLSYAYSLPGLAAAGRTLATRARRLVGGHAVADHGDLGADVHVHDHGEGQATVGIPGRVGRLRDAAGRTWLRAEAAWLRHPRARLPFGHAVVARAHRPETGATPP
jgi:SAM-dependent methyltransferase